MNKKKFCESIAKSMILPSEDIAIEYCVYKIHERYYGSEICISINFCQINYTSKTHGNFLLYGNTTCTCGLKYVPQHYYEDIC